ncbi:unnamed protein product, partial [Brugia timori]|uniref:Electron transfer flavoprotein subunit beta n=1 Tax=Brugia timori TaxID=42155 RepID=A0A0R3Q9R4_9BILA
MPSASQRAWWGVTSRSKKRLTCSRKSVRHGGKVRKPSSARHPACRGGPVQAPRLRAYVGAPDRRRAGHQVGLALLSLRLEGRDPGGGDGRGHPRRVRRGSAGRGQRARAAAEAAGDGAMPPGWPARPQPRRLDGAGVRVAQPLGPGDAARAGVAQSLRGSLGPRTVRRRGLALGRFRHRAGPSDRARRPELDRAVVPLRPPFAGGRAGAAHVRDALSPPLRAVGRRGCCPSRRSDRSGTLRSPIPRRRDCKVKVLVAVKRVLDYNVKARVKSDGSGVDLANQKLSMNPFDEIACEEAVRLKEAGAVTEVIAVSCGSAGCQETLRSAMAIGADRAVLVQTDAPLEPLAVAKLIRHVAQREGVQLAIFGKQAIDDDAGQAGQMFAALMGWAQATFASKVSIADGTASVTREIDGGLEKLRMKLPVVVTTDLRLNEPRFITLPNIMKAKKKPLEVIDAAALGIDIEPRTSTLRVEEPAARKAGIKVADVADLVKRLKEEAKAATLNTVAAAQRLGGDVHVLVAGHDCGAAAKTAAAASGVAKVLHADAAHYGDQGAENLAALVEGFIQADAGYTHVLAPATPFGRNVLPRVAALLDSSQISDVIAIESPDTFRRPFYAGNAIALVQSKDKVKVLSVRTTAFDAVAASGGSAAVQSLPAGPDLGLTEL